NIDQRKILLGSASLMHVATGLFATGTYARRTTEFNNGTSDKDETYWALRAGIAKNWFGVGNTILYGEYNHWDNELASNLGVALKGNEAAVWGLGIVQNLAAA